MVLNKSKPEKETDFTKTPISGQIVECELVRNAGKSGSERLKLAIKDKSGKLHNVYLAMKTHMWRKDKGEDGDVWVAYVHSEYSRLKVKAFDAGVDIIEDLEESAHYFEDLKLPEADREGAKFDKPYIDVFKVVTDPDITENYIKLGVEEYTYEDKVTGKDKTSQSYVVEYFGEDEPEDEPGEAEKSTTQRTLAQPFREPKKTEPTAKEERPAKSSAKEERPAKKAERPEKKEEPAEEPEPEDAEPENIKSSVESDIITSEFTDLCRMLTKERQPMALRDRDIINAIDENGRDKFKMFSPSTIKHFKDPENVDAIVCKFKESGQFKPDGGKNSNSFRLVE
jgi:hypothetical protein